MADESESVPAETPEAPPAEGTPAEKPSVQAEPEPAQPPAAATEPAVAAPVEAPATEAAPPAADAEPKTETEKRASKGPGPQPSGVKQNVSFIKKEEVAGGDTGLTASSTSIRKPSDPLKKTESTLRSSGVKCNGLQDMDDKKGMFFF